MCARVSRPRSNYWLFCFYHFFSIFHMIRESLKRKKLCPYNAMLDWCIGSSMIQGLDLNYGNGANYNGQTLPPLKGESM